MLLLRLAVPGDGLHLGRRGLPQRPVGVPPAAAGPGRDPADPVRHPQLPRASGRPTRPATATASTTALGARWLVERRRRSEAPTTTAPAPRCWSAAACCWPRWSSAAVSSRCGAGRRRPTASDRDDAGSEPEPPTEAAPALAAARRARRPGGARATAGTSWARSLGAAGSLAFVLVLGFFLFRVLPGDPARTLGRGRFQTEEQLEAFRARLRPRPAPAPAVPHLPEEHLHGRPRRLATATGCRSRT